MARCLEAGAEDYLSKPHNLAMLRARIRACLEKTRWHDQEREILRQLEAEREHAERLLYNIFPRSIAERLKHGESHIADGFPEVSVLFADLVGFAEYAARVSPAELLHYSFK